MLDINQCAIRIRATLFGINIISILAEFDQFAKFDNVFFRAMQFRVITSR